MQRPGSRIRPRLKPFAKPFDSWSRRWRGSARRSSKRSSAGKSGSRTKSAGETLGQNLLQAQLRLSEAEAEADQLTEKVETSTAEAKEAEDAARELLTAASSAAERLTMHLEQVPGTDRLAKRAETAADELPAGESANRLPDDAEALTSVLEALATVHDRASRVSLREAELWTAPGRREQVELLSLGHAGFAYRTIEDGRFGLALASPQEAQGYRFSEALSPEQQAGIEDAIAAVRAADDSNRRPFTPRPT
jgi:hypothetical protein